MTTVLINRLQNNHVLSMEYFYDDTTWKLSTQLYSQHQRKNVNCLLIVKFSILHVPRSIVVATHQAELPRYCCVKTFKVFFTSSNWTTELMTRLRLSTVVRRCCKRMIIYEARCASASLSFNGSHFYFTVWNFVKYFPPTFHNLQGLEFLPIILCRW